MPATKLWLCPLRCPTKWYCGENPPFSSSLSASVPGPHPESETPRVSVPVFQAPILRVRRLESQCQCSRPPS
ncbi:hypothetical protein RRG08_024206 [Elysia crispata]|uniref:Uncharacterized protein n=1 Tax=Elysia crispata TaxID=231223 RepID=A0AAE0YQ06_9GAST|nr:hypothetical protein RRG08_024206 [Elysia crispata]